MFYRRTTAESERNAPTATSAGRDGVWFRSNLMKVDTSHKPLCLFVAAAAAARVTAVAVEINVDAGAQ